MAIKCPKGTSEIGKKGANAAKILLRTSQKKKSCAFILNVSCREDMATFEEDISP